MGTYFCDTTAGELKPPAGKCGLSGRIRYKQVQINFSVDYITATWKTFKTKKKREGK